MAALKWRGAAVVSSVLGSAVALDVSVVATYGSHRALADARRALASATLNAEAYTVLPASLSESALRELFTPEQVDVLERLNRADREHLDSLASVVIPRAWRYGPTDYSPLPSASAWAAQHPKAMVVHLPSQVFGAYERGVLVRWGPVSTGRQEHETPSGLFHLNWKAEGRHSTVNREWLMRWYFNFQNERGLSIHEYALPGRPASHACIRMLGRDARWVFDWGEEWTLDAAGQHVLEPGTPLWIVGRYDYGAPPPWRTIEWLSDAIALPEMPAGH